MQFFFIRVILAHYQINNPVIKAGSEGHIILALALLCDTLTGGLTTGQLGVMCHVYYIQCNCIKCKSGEDRYLV